MFGLKFCCFFIYLCLFIKTIILKSMSIELGKFNQLEVVKEVDFGLYLDGGDEGEILLPPVMYPKTVR